MKQKLVAVIIICVALGVFAWHPWIASAQKFEIGGWPIKKTWGQMRGSYIDPKTRELRFIFEDIGGTVRIVTIDSEAKTAVLVTEMRRE